MVGWEEEKETQRGRAERREEGKVGKSEERNHGEEKRKRR